MLCYSINCIRRNQSLHLVLVTAMHMFPNRTKIAYLYLSAAMGTWLGEIEIYRASNWATGVFHTMTRPLIVVGLFGSPAILLLAFAPMNRRQLLITSLLAIMSFFTTTAIFSHSESSTAALIYAGLWLYGIPLTGIGHVGLILWNKRRSTPE